MHGGSKVIGDTIPFVSSGGPSFLLHFDLSYCSKCVLKVEYNNSHKHASKLCGFPFAS